MRLAHGRSTAEGDVEVCIDDIWHAVCYSRFDSTEAQVVCTQLGFSKRSTMLGSICKPLFHYFVVLIDAEVLYFGESAGPISTTAFDCTGDEVALLNCRNYTRSFNCFRHVVVKCEQGIYIYRPFFVCTVLQ